MTTPGAHITRSIREHHKAHAPALVPYITAGFPTRDAFAGIIESVAPHAAAIEVGVPFSDPMADGVTIQRTSRIALEQGAHLRWILDEIATLRPRITTPIILMGYLNPFLRFGLNRLADACAGASVDGLIVPDMPLEESAPLRNALNAAGVGLVQLVSPMTPPERARQIAHNSDGFLYAVTIAGTTGGAISRQQPIEYLQRTRALSPVPVCAGFGIRTGADIAALADHVDGVIVGSALMEAVEQGRNPGAWLHELRQQATL